MPPVFSRSLPEGHPWDAALAELFDSSPENKALAENLMYDHRVSKQREQEINPFGQANWTVEVLRRALKDFHFERICQTPSPDFLQAHNHNNLLSGNTTCPRILSKDLELARVIDLHRLSSVYQYACKRRVSPFDDLDAKTDEGLAKWLDEKLRLPRRRPAFIAAVLKAMNEYQSGVTSYHPSWVTTWEAFSRYAKDPAVRWTEVVGVHKDQPARWLIVLRYTVREAGAVFRPTQLDAGWYPYHFPSPPHAPLTVGGHPMDLQHIPAATELLPEYIHPQIKHTLAHWTRTGFLCEKTYKSCSSDFVQQRQQHRQLLDVHYGPAPSGWMP